MPRNRTSKPPPPGYEVIEAVIEALENELRDKVKESNLNKRNTESIWPIHQINHQRSRYVYDMYYTYKKISKKVYDYCLKYKIADALLIAKWKKAGYERLCSTYVINPSNYKFGTTSICRVPTKDRGENAKNAIDPTTGCMGCASGIDAGPKNIFGNKYGQNLAAVQIARDKRMEIMKAKREHKQRQQEEEEQRIAIQQQINEEEERKIGNQEQQQDKKRQLDDDDSDSDNDAGDSETDDETDDEDDYGPSPAAGVWAGSKKLEAESEVIAEGDDNDEKDDDNEARPNKKLRAE